MCDTYLPKASPNGICVSEVAKALVKNGERVRIVTTPNIAEQKAEESVDGIPVYRVDPGYVVRVLNETDGKNDPASLQKRRRALKLSRISGAVNARRYPLTAPEQVSAYLKCAERLNSKEAIDVLVCCYHKIAAVAAGIKFKKRHPNTKLVVYTLDAISGGLVFPVLRSMKISMAALKRWEKRIFATADRLFVMESHRSHYEKSEYDGVRDKLEYLDIPLVRTDRMGEYAGGDVTEFVYTGSMSTGTANPSRFLEILSTMTADDYVFHIYGNATADIEGLINCAALPPEKLVMHGSIPYHQVDGIQRGADILLNFGNANPCMIPCKIFEYISTGKKILSFTHSEQDSSLPYLRKYPNALIINEDDDIAVSAERIRAFMRSDYTAADAELIKNIYEKNTPEYFCRQIKLL